MFGGLNRLIGGEIDQISPYFNTSADELETKNLPSAISVEKFAKVRRRLVSKSRAHCRSELSKSWPCRMQSSLLRRVTNTSRRT